MKDNNFNFEIDEYEQLTKDVIDAYNSGINPRTLADEFNISIDEVFMMLTNNDIDIEYHEICPLYEAVNFYWYLYDSLSSNKKSETEKKDIKLRLVEDSDTPNGIISNLINDEDEDIRLTIVKRENVPEYILEMALLNATRKIQWELIRNEKTPTNILMRLFTDVNIMHRMKLEIINRPNISDEILNVAMLDKDDDISNAAKDIYNKPFDDLIKQIFFSEENNKNLRNEEQNDVDL